MTEELPQGLRRVLDDLPVGQAPVGALLTEAARLRRRRRTTFGAAAVVVAIAAGGVVTAKVVGAGEGGSPPAAQPGSTDQSADAPTEGTTFDVPTNGWRPGDGGDSALITGTLGLDRRGCLVLQDSQGKQTRVTWPAGHTTLVDTDGRTHLLDAAGKVVASVGDEISAGGGYGGVDRSAHRCLAGKEPVASVQSEVTVTKAATPNAAPDLPDPTGEPDDAAYQAWLGRTPLPECGEQWIGPFLGLSGRTRKLAFAACLRAAAEAGTGGEAVLHYTTVEGDPISTYLRVLPDESVEIFEDSTLDRFGSKEWRHATCTDLQDALELFC